MFVLPTTALSYPGLSQHVQLFQVPVKYHREVLISWKSAPVPSLLFKVCGIKQKSCSAFNFYSNALSAVIFSLKMVFCLCQFSFLPSRVAQSVLLKRLACKRPRSSPLHRTYSSASIFGGTADVDVCLKEILPYYHHNRGRFVHTDTGSIRS